MDNPRTAKIFIVEDEALIAAEIKSTLQLLGHRNRPGTYHPR